MSARLNRLRARRPWLIVVVTAAFTVASVGAAAAALTGASGGTIEEVKVVSDTDQTLITLDTWTDVPGAELTVKVPKRKTALVIARYTAESECLSYQVLCYLRIEVENQTSGTSTELNPQSGDDFLVGVPREFLGPSDIGAHAVDRSITLDGGRKGTTYTVQVQGRVSQRIPEETLILDDWHLTVEWAEVTR